MCRWGCFLYSAFKLTTYFGITQAGYNELIYDGMQDIRVHFTGSGLENLLLYDSLHKSFVQVENFDAYPEPLPVQGTRYYYSYRHSGCADMDWNSDLFYIAGYKTICIGNIEGLQCDDPGEKQGIFIYKIHNDKKSLYQTLPVDSIAGYDDKWGFIKSYWANNYGRFAK